MWIVCVFFFKQKTAYEMRISDWSSDVCSSDLLLPMMNYPAVRGGRRTSPIDGGNLNRLFPGKPDGGITQKIADYVTTALLPLADVVVDLHSGGKTLEFVPYAACHRLPQDTALHARCAAAMQAFNAPYSMKIGRAPGRTPVTHAPPVC